MSWRDGPKRTMPHELRQFLWLVLALMSALLIWDFAQIFIKIFQGNP